MEAVGLILAVVAGAVIGLGVAVPLEVMRWRMVREDEARRRILKQVEANERSATMRSGSDADR